MKSQIREGNHGQRTQLAERHIHRVLLLDHGGVDVFHPRGILHVRSGRFAPQKPRTYADEEYDAHSAGDHYLLLLWLVDLLRLPKWSGHHRRSRRGTARGGLERADGTASGGCWRSRWLGAAQRRVLGGVPAVFLDRGLDCLWIGHRAHPLLRVLDFGYPHRLGILGH